MIYAKDLSVGVCRMPVSCRSFSFRSFGATLAIFSVLVGSPSARAAACHPSNDIHAAFNLEGLKSELMVTALSCKTQSRYNEFVGHFRPLLNKAEKRIETYFHSTYGRQGDRKRDDYITQLADVQSLGGLKSGTVFCDQRVPMFDELAALDTADDLSHYAEAKDIAQPASYESCTAPHPAVRSRHGRTAHHK